MKFSVRHVSPATSAEVTVSVMESLTEQAVREQLTAAGHAVLSVTLVKNDVGEVHSTRQFDVTWWCRELRTLLHAGMTVVEAIETLHAQGVRGARAQVQNKLRASLLQGQALSKAMAQSGAFPEVLVASVMASERTSTLVSALDDYLVHEELLQKMKRQALSAAIYPGVVMTLGASISLFLLLYVVPRFSRMYEDVQGAASLPTRVLLHISHAVQHGWWAIAAVAALLAATLMWAWQEGHLKRAVLALASRVDWLQRQLDQFRLAKLYQSLALMFKGGYTFDEAMAMCERLDLGGDFTSRLQQARTAIAQGKPIAGSMAQAGLTELVTERLLAVGERTGSFDAVLVTIAQRHAEKFATFIERATRIVEPLLLLIVALAVGGIVVLMYMPIFDIAASIG